jgi:hypothetical protein
MIFKDGSISTMENNIKTLKYQAVKNITKFIACQLNYSKKIWQLDPQTTCCSKTLTNTDEILPAISIKGMLGI